MPKPTVEVEFWNRVDKNGPIHPIHGQCWVWTGARRRGYGFIYCCIKETAHRVSWKIHNGDIPDDLCVLHKCDNPPCVNPDHLFLGTQTENNKDRARKWKKLPSDWR